MENRYVKSLVRRFTQDSDSKKRLFELATVLRADELMQEDEDKALNLLNNASKVVPESALLAYNLGVALATKGRYDEAIDSYKKAIQRSSRFSEAHHNLGAALAKKKNFRDAIKAYNKALGLNPNFAEAYNNLGAALAATDEVAKAISAYSKAIELNKQFPEAYHNRGIAYANAGNDKEAIADYKRALSLRPRYSSALSNLGIALFRTGQTEPAIESYEKALKIEQSAGVLRNLAIAYKKKGDFTSAIGTLNKSLRLQPDDPKTHVTLGTVYQDLGNDFAKQDEFHSAIRSYEDALKAIRRGKGPLDTARSEVEILNSLANAFLNISDRPKALAALQEAADLDPNDPVIRKNLNSLLEEDASP